MSPLAPCLIFSHTCTAKRIERFVTDLQIVNLGGCPRDLMFTSVQSLYAFVPSREVFCVFSQTLDPYDRPWASSSTRTVKNSGSEEKLTKPAKGTCPESAVWCPECCGSLLHIVLNGAEQVTSGATAVGEASHASDVTSCFTSRSQMKAV